VGAIGSEVMQGRVGQTAVLRALLRAVVAKAEGVVDVVHVLQRHTHLGDGELPPVHVVPVRPHLGIHEHVVAERSEEVSLDVSPLLSR